LGAPPGKTNDLPADEQIAFSLHCMTYDEILRTVRSMSSADKAKVLASIHENKSGHWYTVNPYVMISLGDPQARKDAVAEFRFIRSNSPKLVRLGEPWVIEELAPDMFLNENNTEDVWASITRLHPSYAATSLIMENLHNSTIYRDEVLQWAKRINIYDVRPLRPVMRDWWLANERFFKEKNYKAVQPGRDLAIQQTNASPPPMQPTPVADSHPSPKSSQTPPPPQNQSAEPSSILAVLITTLCAAFLVTLWVVSHRGKRPS